MVPEENFRIGVVVSRFNEEITERLLETSLAELKSLGVLESHILVCKVPGAFEIPGVAQRLAMEKKFDAIVCLGAVIRGETAHFDYICQAVLPALVDISRECGIPVTNGIITAYTEDQALLRSGGRESNVGVHAVRAAIEVVRLLQDLPEKLSKIGKKT